MYDASTKHENSFSAEFRPLCRSGPQNFTNVTPVYGYWSCDHSCISLGSKIRKIQILFCEDKCDKFRNFILPGYTHTHRHTHTTQTHTHTHTYTPINNTWSTGNIRIF